MCERWGLAVAEVDGSGRDGRGGAHDVEAKEHAAGASPRDTPYADYPSVFPNLPGREATNEEFREYFGDLEPDSEP